VTGAVNDHGRKAISLIAGLGLDPLSVKLDKYSAFNPVRRIHARRRYAASLAGAAAIVPAY